MEQSADRPDCPPAVSAGLVQDRAAVDSLNQALEELGPHPDIKHLKDLCRQTLDQMKTITARGLNTEQKEWYEGFKKLRELHFVDKLARNANGKVLRGQFKKQ